MSKLLLERKVARRLSDTYLDNRYLSRDSSRVALALLENSAYYGTRDDYEIFLLEYCSARSGISQEYLISEGFFDTLKKMASAVAAAPKKLSDKAGKATAGGKQFIARHIPQLYAHGTHKFWKHAELAKKAKADYDKIMSELESSQDRIVQMAMKDIKKALQSGAKGLDFPNMRNHEDFMKYLFGVETWDEHKELEKKLQNSEPAAAAKLLEKHPGIWWAMFGARNYMQSQISLGNVPLDQVDEKVKEFNGIVDKFRKMLTFYAREVKEVYRTFENKQYVHHGKLVSLIIEEAEKDEKKSKGDDFELTEDMMEELELGGLDDKDLMNRMKSSQSPVVPLVIGILMVIGGAIGVKWNEARIAKQLVPKIIENPDRYVSEVKNVPAVVKGLATKPGQGFTQFVAMASNLYLGTEFDTEKGLIDMPVKDFIDILEELGLYPNETFFNTAFADPENAAKVLQGAEDSPMKLRDFFDKLNKDMSGKGGSIFQFNKGVYEVIAKKAAKEGFSRLIKGGAIASVSNVAGIGAMAFYGPYLVAFGGAGFLTVAALRKFKNNRFKTLMGLIDALEDIKPEVMIDEEDLPSKEDMPKTSPLGTPDPNLDFEGEDPDVLPIEELPVNTGWDDEDEDTEVEEEMEEEAREYIEKQDDAKDLDQDDLDPFLDTINTDLVIRALVDRGYEKSEAEDLMDAFFDDSDEGKQNIADLTDDRPPKPEALMAGFVHKNSLTALLTEDADTVIPFEDFAQRMTAAAKRAKVNAPERSQNAYAAVAFNISHQIGDVDEMPSGAEKIQVKQEIENIDDIIDDLKKMYKKKYKGKAGKKWKKREKKLIKKYSKELGIKDLDIEKLKKEAEKMQKASEEERMEFYKAMRNLTDDMNNQVAAKDAELGELNAAIESLRQEMIENADNITKEKQAEIDKALEELGLTQQELEVRDYEIEELEKSLAKKDSDIETVLQDMIALEEKIAELEAKTKAVDSAKTTYAKMFELIKGHMLAVEKEEKDYEFEFSDELWNQMKDNEDIAYDDLSPADKKEVSVAVDDLEKYILKPGFNATVDKEDAYKPSGSAKTVENSWREGDIILERWQKMAGLLKD